MFWFALVATSEARETMRASGLNPGPKIKNETMEQSNVQMETNQMMKTYILQFIYFQETKKLDVRLAMVQQIYNKRK